MGTPAVAVEEKAELSAGSLVSAAKPHAGVTTARRPRVVHTGAVVVLVVGLALTAVLALGARSIHDNNEARLLHQRVREAAAVLTSALPSVQTPLTSAALLASATHGEPIEFRHLTSPLISAGRPFVSVSLWTLGPAAVGARELVVVGSPPEIGAERNTFFARTNSTALSINDLLNGRDRRVGYAMSANAGGVKYVAYAEAALPKDRRANIDKNSAFADLGYALYLGTTADPRELIASSTSGGQLHGRTDFETVPFGDESLRLVMTPHKELGGTLLARLPFVLGVAGLLLTLLVAALVERLTLQRRHAQRLADENAQLYLDQRSIAQTLQNSLLPDVLPGLGGIEFAARYVAGVQGVDIGGDWYDVIPVDDGRAVVVVGDVSGCGLKSATMMASLRFAAHAYALQGDSPATIVSKLSKVISVGRDGHFATLVCVLVDVRLHQITITNAGHPPPLLISGADRSFLTAPVGVPVGVNDERPRTETTIVVAPDATLLLYTDGLVERRGELLDAGLARLKQAVADTNGSLESVLDTVLQHSIPDGSDDDTALLGLRWQK